MCRKFTFIITKNFVGSLDFRVFRQVFLLSSGVLKLGGRGLNRKIIENLPNNLI